LGLDPQTRNKIWEHVLDIHKKEKITLFLTTHYMDEAEYCDRIAVIDHGKIIATGTPAQLKKKTRAKTMNDVFLELTGRDIRDEVPSRTEKMKARMRRRFHR
jgi:ABC-2 type transport system ATP-binding protein